MTATTDNHELRALVQKWIDEDLATYENGDDVGLNSMMKRCRELRDLLARTEAGGCPECGASGLLFECVACSHTNYPQDASGDAAELLAADLEYDAAEVAWDALDRRDGLGDDRDVRDYDGPEYMRLCAAISRRARAIAAMQAKEAK